MFHLSVCCDFNARYIRHCTVFHVLIEAYEVLSTRDFGKCLSPSGQMSASGGKHLNSIKKALVS